MVRKKIDNRIRTVIEEGVSKGHRTLFALVGDKGRDQVVILHHMLSKAAVRARPTVLWTYKNELSFSNNRKKKMRKMEKDIKAGKMKTDQENPFDLFVASTTIRYCYYKDTHKILGNTFGMVVLQDFEALTPNLLARTVETVEGGGLIVILLKSVDSLKQLYTMTMDVHTRYRTEAHGDITGRFNERFILSLASCKRAIVADDGLNILPISTHVKRMSTTSENVTAVTEETANDIQLREVKDKFQEVQPTGSLMNLCKTLDQAKALLEFVDAITDKKLDRTVSLTAGRGRGKSAALGLAIAASIGFGYTNVFVTSPSPENLKTLFEFVFKAFDAMGYEEHTDYDIVQSVNPEFNNAVVRVNIHEERNGNRRQTIQYLHPHDAQKLGQAELLVIDEAAAIPLPYVKELLGPYLVFMASTINGYEGTGRSLSLKLLESLRQQQNPLNKASAEKKKQLVSRMLREVTLEESIRYKPGDAIEEWLNRLLCLDATQAQPLSGTGCPSREDCDLYYINRDTLFCYHKASEAFLQRLMSLYVSSHYKNTPNDLQMLSDAPAHHLFCLLGPTDPDSAVLPEVLCVVQVCLEGEISKQSIMQGLSRGKRASGDLIPWTMAQQFQDDNFPSLSGARVVRIATHPDYQRMGYGSKALELLQKYYEMKIPNLNEDVDFENSSAAEIETVQSGDVSLLEEQIAPRRNLPPLLLKLSERKPERLDYLGVSFGVTQELLRFWKRAGFVPTYLRQTANELTGEHSMIMLKVLSHAQQSWLPMFWADFRKRFVNLLGFDFKKFTPALALGIITNKIKSDCVQATMSADQMSSTMITPYDLKRLEQYASNMADYHLIMDLVPSLAKLHFLYEVENLNKPNLGAVQQAILAGIGLQCKSVDTLASELDVPASQLLGLMNTMLRKYTANIKGCQEAVIASSLASKVSQGEAKASAVSKAPLAGSMNDELEAAAADLKAKQQRELEKMKLGLDLSQYAIKGDDKEWEAALANGKSSKTLSVKTGEKRLADELAKNSTPGDEGDSTQPSKKKKKKKSKKAEH